jgi:hypothetical protein
MCSARYLRFRLWQVSGEWQLWQIQVFYIKSNAYHHCVHKFLYCFSLFSHFLCRKLFLQIVPWLWQVRRLWQVQTLDVIFIFFLSEQFFYFVSLTFHHYDLRTCCSDPNWLKENVSFGKLSVMTLFFSIRLSRNLWISCRFLLTSLRKPIPVIRYCKEFILVLL